MTVPSSLQSAVLALFLATACAPSNPPAPATGTPEAARETTAETTTRSSGGTVRTFPEEERPPRQNVILDQPADGETLRQNPVVVRGRARTFENNVQIRIRDAAGDEIRQTFTTATGEMGNFNPFGATLYVTRDPGERLVIEAFELSAKDGSLDSLDRATVAFAVPLKPVTLFFPRSGASDTDCTKVFPVERQIPNSVSLARLLVEALLDGPTATERAKGFTPPFPEWSRIDSVNLRSGVLRVDFDERLQNVGGACRAQAIRAAVTATLKNLPEITDVVISAGGSEAMALQP